MGPPRTWTTQQFHKYRNSPTGRLLQPTPGLKTPERISADVDFSSYNVPDVPQIHMEVIENPPVGTRQTVTYNVVLDVHVAGFILSWSIYFDYVDGERPKYKPHPNILVSARGLPEYHNKGMGLAAPTMSDPNKLLDMYFYAYAQWLKKVVPEAMAKKRTHEPMPGTTPMTRHRVIKTRAPGVPKDSTLNF